jgi:hypothetical protein
MIIFAVPKNHKMKNVITYSIGFARSWLLVAIGTPGVFCAVFNL